MKFKDLKVGDRVHRRMGHDGPTMEMQVVKVTDDLIECGAVNKDGSIEKLGWTFDRETGVEEDEELGWGKKFGVTGTYLERIQ